MVSFNVLSLFSSGEQGAWYDPSDFIPNWRRNLLTRSEEFDNAAWTKNFILPFGSGSIANATASPSGAVSADKIVVDTNNGLHVLYNTTAIPVVVSTNYTGSVYVKAAEYGFAFVALNIRASSSNCGVCVNLSDGAQTNGGANGTYTVTSAGNGWWLVSVSAIASSTNGYLEVTPRSTAGGPVVYTGDGVSGIYVWGAQLQVGSSVTAYQKITDGVADYFTVQPQPVMFQDSAGTTPVTAVEQPVGLIFDKSKGLALGAELIADPSFNTPASWTASAGSVVVTGGAAVWTSAAAAVNVQPSAGLAPVSGRWYYAEVTITAISAGALRVGNEAGVALSPDFTTTGKKTFYFSAPSASPLVLRAVGTTTATVSDYSVRELPGNHASQATSTSRPVLSARVNLLTYSEDLSNVAWSKDNTTVSANSTTAPDGQTTADTLTASALLSIHRVISAAVTVASGVGCTHSVCLKAGTHSFAQIHDGASASYFANFNLSAGTVGTVTGCTATMVPLGNGWYRCSIAMTLNAANPILCVGIISSATAARNESWTTAGTETIFLWGADVRVTNDGVGIPAYQRINAATDYDTSGFPLYLAFDGVDDSLATASVDFSATDKMSVFAGVRKLSDAADGMVYQMGDASALQSGAFELTAPGSSTVTKFQFLSRGTVNAIPFTTSTTYNAPYTGVIAGLGDISGDAATLRINGAQIAQILTDQGTGNYGNYPLYIGRRAGTSLPYNGRLYSLIVRGASTNADQLARTETWVNNITKAY
jgi:hypothetical protein